MLVKIFLVGCLQKFFLTINLFSIITAPVSLMCQRLVDFHEPIYHRLLILYINPISFPGEITLEIHEVLTSYWQEFDIQCDPTIQNSNLQLPDTMNAVKFMMSHVKK